MAVVGTVYLLHFEPPYLHARHYIGWTSLDVDVRLRRHTLERHGSPLVRAAVDAGCDVRVARTWPGEDRHTERRLKNQKNAARFCPLCKRSRAG